MWRNTRRIEYEYLILDEAQGHEKCPNQDCPTLTWLWGSACVCPYLGHRLKSCGWTLVHFPNCPSRATSQLKENFKIESWDHCILSNLLSWDGKRWSAPRITGLDWNNLPQWVGWKPKTIYLAQLKQIQDRVRTSSEEELNRSKVEILSVSCAFAKSVIPPPSYGRLSRR